MALPVRGAIAVAGPRLASTISIDKSGALVVPNDPIIPFIEVRGRSSFLPAARELSTNN